MILLADEEIDELLIYEGTPKYANECDVIDVVAKAQLKKDLANVIEYIERLGNDCTVELIKEMLEGVLEEAKDD